MSFFASTTSSTTNDAKECADCKLEGFTSPMTYSCSDCSSELCCYHGQKHMKENPIHTVSKPTSSTSLFGSPWGTSSGSTSFSSTGSIFGSATSGSTFGNTSIFGSSSSSNANSSSGIFFTSSTNVPTISSSFGTGAFGSSSASASQQQSNDVLPQLTPEEILKKNQETIVEFDKGIDSGLADFIEKSSNKPINTNCKLLLVGEPCGKSSYVRRIIDDKFQDNYVATIGVDCNPKTFETTHGNITFTIWDCAGQEKFGGLRDGYYIMGQCGIIMFDKHSFNSVPNWHRDISRVCENIPIVLCLNKADLLSEEERLSLKARAALFCWRKNCINYFELSNKDNLNLEDPLEFLAKALMKDKNVSFLSKIKKEQQDLFHQKLQNTLMTSDANINTTE